MYCMQCIEAYAVQWFDSDCVESILPTSRVKIFGRLKSFLLPDIIIYCPKQIAESTKFIKLHSNILFNIWKRRLFQQNPFIFEHLGNFQKVYYVYRKYKRKFGLRFNICIAYYSKSKKKTCQQISIFQNIICKRWSWFFRFASCCCSLVQFIKFNFTKQNRFLFFVYGLCTLSFQSGHIFLTKAQGWILFQRIQM